MRILRVRTFYPADPVGVVPGGVDTFIRGLIKWAPEDIHFSLVGMTTDTCARPIGQWTRCNLGRRYFDFFPVVRVADAGARTRLPLSLRFTWGAARYFSQCKNDFDLYEFHRVEPALLYLRDPKPKNAFFHQDMAVIRTESKSDIVWKYAPAAYFLLESGLARSLSSAWCVREQGAEALRKRYPLLAENIRFIPTWVDTEVFSPLPEEARVIARASSEAELGLDPKAFRLISVGRLDSQKDPDMLLTVVGKLVAENRNVELLMIGDGVLRPALERRVIDQGLSSRVRFLGLRSPAEISGYMQVADCFALSSVYEGMPMALLEALGAGVPVVTTPVGEVGRVVRSGFNGEITEDRSPEAFISALLRIMDGKHVYAPHHCVSSIESFVPHKVLASVYENYRVLGNMGRGG